jgi:hypothetical protein
VTRYLLEAFAPYRHEYTAGGFADTTATVDVVRERFKTAKIWLAVTTAIAVGTVTAFPEERADLYSLDGGDAKRSGSRCRAGVA